MSVQAVAQSFTELGLEESFRELLAEMDRVGEEAEDGQLMNAMEGVALFKGRDLLRKCLENRMQAAIEAAEKKGPASARNVRKRGETKASGQKRS